MQQCPFCDKVYDESEYSHCPYCSGELEDGDDEFVHALNAVVAYIRMEKLGNVQTVTTTGAFAVMCLSVNIDRYTGF